MSGFIYFVAAETLNALKIGFSAEHPSIRLKAIQTGCPAPLKLLAYVEGPQSEERQLHKVFAALRMHGEWFRYEGDLKFLVARLLNSNRAAPRVRFDSALKRIIDGQESNDYQLDYFEMPLGHPFRGDV